MGLSAMENAALACVAELSLLRFFPGDEFARAALVRMLTRMASKPEQLRWLSDTVLQHYGEWPGPNQIRAVFCTRFRPADGVETWLDPSVPSSGALAAELEQRAIEGHEQRKQALPTAEAMRLLGDAKGKGLVQ